MKLVQIQPQVQEIRYSWRDRKSGFTTTCHVTCYLVFPAVEWTILFRNGTNGNSPILENVKSIDQKFVWYADVKQVDNHSWSLEAGLERMKLFLYPDEENYLDYLES